jgi:tRNA(Ile)-lysidine synthase
MAKIQPPSQARLRGLGLEAVAREARYKALAKMAKKSMCSAILTAHTADDQAETVLMNLLRGAGASGLAGIPPARELATGLPVLRPLLGISRREILAYLRRHRLPYRTDPTNRQRRFTRNRIRQETLPYLQKRFPGLSQRLVQLGAILRDEEDYWNRGIDKQFKETVRKNGQLTTVDLTRLLGYHKALGRRILRRAVGAIPFQDVERLFAWASSSNGSPLLKLAGGLQVTRKGPKLSIRRRN